MPDTEGAKPSAGGRLIDRSDSRGIHICELSLKKKRLTAFIMTD